MKSSLKMKWGLLISTLFFVSTIIIAQPGRGKGPHQGQGYDSMPDSCRAKCMIDNLSKELSLDAGQKQKIETIHLAHFEKMKGVLEQDSTCLARNRELHDKMRDDMDKEIKAVLTEPQKAKYDSIMTGKRGPYRGCPNRK